MGKTFLSILTTSAIVTTKSEKNSATITKNKRTRTNLPPNSTENRPTKAITASSSKRSGSATSSKSNLKSNLKLTGTDIAASLKDTPLESLAEVVASLPKQISTLIKDKATLMFSLFRELKEREASLNLYDKEIVNKETGETVECRPKCCRHTNPITYSRFLKENDKLKETLAKYDQLMEDFNSEGTKLMRMVAKLKVEARTDELCKEIIETLHSLVNNFIIFEVIKNKTYIPPLTTN